MKDMIIGFIVNHWKEIVIVYVLKSAAVAGYLVWRRHKDKIITRDFFHSLMFNEIKNRALIALY